MNVRLLKQDFTLGALYRIGADRGFSREILTRLMIERVGLKQKPAEQLAAHWMTTEPFRKHQEHMS
jgi:hypothetical protein